MRSPYSTGVLYEEVPIQCCVTGYSSPSDSGFATRSVTLVANVWSDALTAGRVKDLTNQNSTYHTCTSTQSFTLFRMLVCVQYNTRIDEHFTRTSAAVETVYRDPQFVSWSPCPCDLTPGVCDYQCCCDPVRRFSFSCTSLLSVSSRALVARRCA